MKRLMVLGGMLGFSVSLGIGFMQGQAWPYLFLRASLCAYAVGWLLRWWGGVWARSWKQTQMEIAVKAAEEEATDNATEE